MFQYTRRIALTAFAALALTACSQADNGAGTTPPKAPGSPTLTEIALGSPDAPITMVEYASWTCTHCLQFDETVMPMVRTDYIETGKVRYIFREFPTPPANIAVAGFKLARCSGEDAYYPFISDLFANQTKILNQARAGSGVEQTLRDIAAGHGITGQAFDDCLSNQEVTRAISAVVLTGDAQGVNSTPTLFINGEMLPGYDWRTAEGMKTLLDGLLEAESE